MLVDKLNLKNFRKYEDFEIEFKDRLTVIIGANGSGKSTIIDATGKLLSVVFRSLFDFKSETMRKNDIRLNKGEKCFPVEISMSGYVSGLECSYTQTMKYNGNRNSYAASEVSGIYNDKLAKENDNTVLPVVCAYGAGRLWNNSESISLDNLTKTSFSRKNGYSSCLDAHLDSKSMNIWFEKMTYLELQSRKSDALLSAVTEAVEDAFKLLSGFSSVKVQSNLLEHELEVTYKDKKKKEHVLLTSQLSDGYRCFICLIADIAYRMASVNPGLKKKAIKETDGIILIDEIDLHLHPEWQQRILEVLMKVFPKVQFIVTTHAPAVINSAKRESLIILNGDKAEYPSIETYGRDMNTITNTVMGVSERPEKVKKLFTLFEEQLDSRNFKDARDTVSRLEEILKTDDADLASCKVRLDFEEELESE
jgi:predicted ATP-binding protein involved in virulence